MSSVGTRIRIATTSAAPSATAVFDHLDLPVAELMPLIWARGWKCTKAIVIRRRRDAELLVDFVQIRPAANGVVRTETRGDCGNSMVAAGIAVATETGDTKLQVCNKTTGMLVSVHRLGQLVAADFSADLTGRSPGEFVLPSPAGVTILDAMNPYVVVRTANAGALLADDPGSALLDRLREMRRNVAARLGWPLDGEFPKIAIAGWSTPRRIVARTVYLEQWHPGLPLTGGVTVAMAALAQGTVLFDGARSHVTATDGRSGVAVEITRDRTGIRRCTIRGLRVALLDDLTVPHAKEKTTAWTS